MERRTANRGRGAAGEFWGCSNFPQCWYTRRLNQRAPRLRATGVANRPAPTCAGCAAPMRSLVIPPPHEQANKQFWYCPSDTCATFGASRLEVTEPTCPNCQRRMFPHRGTEGRHAGRWFWRCPGCDLAGRRPVGW
jgi:ssDNA-binding Zn-finger/Zn-ribbon topoisomerase 1